MIDAETASAAKAEQICLKINWAKSGGTARHFTRFVIFLRGGSRLSRRRTGTSDGRNSKNQTGKRARAELKSILSTATLGKVAKYGIDVAIVGSPNVGKSSLLNALLGSDRAIVSDIQGTTRDTLRESVNYKDIKFNFVDTAGIRDTNDIW